MKIIFEKSKEKRGVAKQLIEDSGLGSVLKEFQDYQFLGSYELDLMLDANDIDLKILSDNPKQDSKKFFDILWEKSFFQKMEYGDFVNFSRENRPNGFIVNLRKEVLGEKWEIEVWFVDKNDFEKSKKELEKIREKLDEKNKEKILIEKEKRFLNREDKFQKSSFEIYKNILGLG